MSQDYSDIGLNSQLQTVNSIADRGSTSETGFDFDTQYERGIIDTIKIKDAAITSAKIDTFNFNAGTGGTIVLGGTNNGNGILSVRDSGGTERISLDNTGMTINNGSITIKDASNNTVLDSQGLVSTTAFLGAGAGTASSLSFLQQITAAENVYVDVTGATINIVATRNTLVLIQGRADCGIQGTSPGGAAGRLAIDIAGTTTDNCIFFADYDGIDNYGYSNTCIPTNVHFLGTVINGTTTIKLKTQFALKVGYTAINIYGYRLTAVKLGV